MTPTTVETSLQHNTSRSLSLSPRSNGDLPSPVKGYSIVLFLRRDQTEDFPKRDAGEENANIGDVISESHDGLSALLSLELCKQKWEF